MLYGRQRAYIERRNYYDESDQELYEQAVDLGDLLQAVRRCGRSVVCTHWRHCGMGKLEGTQGTERNSESKSGRVRDLIKIRPLPFLFFDFERRFKMEDIMHIQSGFLRRLVSAAVGKAIQKQGLDAAVQLNDLRVNYADKSRTVRVHLDIDAEMTQETLVDILSKAGVL